MGYKKRLFIFWTTVLLIGGVTTILFPASKQYFGEYKNIRKIARVEMTQYSTDKCAKYSDIKVVRIYENYALLDVIPDMKHCITDQIQMVMKKNDEGWKFVILGSFIEIDAMVVNPDGTESPYLSGRESLPKQLFEEKK
jgi:hypothetical protein